MEPQSAGRNLEIVLVHELSSGTFARLYLAEVRAPGGIERIVAVKILREQWSESVEILNRTRDEARLLARLRHKNILRVEDLAEIDGQLAIIMEFVDGLDLKQLVDALTKERRRAPPRAILEICSATASALDAAHNRVPYGLDGPLHVVHRDIKPSNIMVSAEGEVKVLDFGTARSTQQRSAQTGALRFGSLKYMSPERREGDRGEIASDVYALGLTLLELLRGEWLPLLPLDVMEHDEALVHHVARLGDLVMPNPEWDRALRDAILRMVSGEASHRPPITEVQKLLRAFADQASGPTLETFAQEHVARLTRALHGDTRVGALSGTRFVLNVLPEAAAGGNKVVKPKATHKTIVPEQDRPTTAATHQSMAPPEDWGDEATVQRPNPIPEPPPSQRPVLIDPEPFPPEFPEDEEPPQRTSVLIWVGVAAFALFVFAMVVAVAIGAWFYLSAPSAPSVEAVPTPVPVTPVVPAPVGTAPLEISAPESAVQWIRLESGSTRVAEGKETLSAKVAADAYTLSVKLVGKPAQRGPLSVPEAGASLICTTAKNGNLTCAGMKAPVLLKP
ncbi:MAG: serine/threonine protein kinase [Myxococcales bacterium]|nr:serine/threonine protein kinase [Myxococcales bacterium]